MTNGVIYLLTGPSHAVRLIVSLWSLRRFYRGPVTVYLTQDDSERIVRPALESAALGPTTVRRVEALKTRRNSAFLTKVALLPRVPYAAAMYLDADTLIAGDISPLLEAALSTGFAATNFSNWSSSTKVIRRRVERWLALDAGRWNERLPGLVRSALEPRPAVNGGVFAFRPDSPLLRPWFELAMVGRSTFICDEVALQILLHHHPHEVLDCRFNCSPIHAGNTKDVRIWHFHGEKHLRPEAAPLWLAAFAECARTDLGGITQWALPTDEKLAAHLRRPAEPGLLELRSLLVQPDPG